MSIQAFDQSSYWYNLSSYNDGKCIFISILLKCGLVRQQVVSGDMTTIFLYEKWKSFIAEYE